MENYSDLIQVNLERTIDSSGFSIEGTITSAPAVPNSKVLDMYNL